MLLVIWDIVAFMQVNDCPSKPHDDLGYQKLLRWTTSPQHLDAAAALGMRRRIQIGKPTATKKTTVS